MSSSVSVRKSSSPGRGVLGVVGVLLALAVWQALPALGLVPERALPGALAVLGALGTLLGNGEFWAAVWATLAGAGLGLLIAVVAGVLVGTLMGAVRLLGSAFTPAVEFLRPVPGVALIPVAILMFGPGLTSDVALVVFGCVWVVIVQTIYGIKAVEQVAIQTAKSFRMSHLNRIRYVQIPSALPFIATGVRIASAIALIIAVTAELVAGNDGLGSSIALAQSTGRTDDMYAYIVTAGLLGILAHFAFGSVERRLLHWHESQRAGT